MVYGKILCIMQEHHIALTQMYTIPKQEPVLGGFYQH
jgi:hypothetical protein